jgi:hypothetical protein
MVAQQSATASRLEWLGSQWRIPSPVPHLFRIDWPAAATRREIFTSQANADLPFIPLGKNPLTGLPNQSGRAMTWFPAESPVAEVPKWHR